MRNISYSLAYFTIALISCRAFAGDADETKKLQGTWEVVELIAYGKKVEAEAIKGTKFVFAKDKLTVQSSSDKADKFVARSFTFKLNPAKKPAEVELTVLDVKDKGVVSVGIYELKGDTLRWCQSDAVTSPERPKEFASPDKSPFYLFTLKRAK